MKVKLLQDWIGKPVGTVIELSDAKAKRLIKTGLVKKVKRNPPRRTKPKERNDERTKETSGI